MIDIIFSDFGAILVPLIAPEEGTLQINLETHRATWKTVHTP